MSTPLRVPVNLVAYEARSEHLATVGDYESAGMLKQAAVALRILLAQQQAPEPSGAPVAPVATEVSTEHATEKQEQPPA